MASHMVKGTRGIQFRRWATEHLSEYLVKGFTMDDESCFASFLRVSYICGNHKVLKQ